MPGVRERRVGDGAAAKDQLDVVGGVEGHRCPRSFSQYIPHTSPHPGDCPPIGLAQPEVVATSPSMRAGGRSSIVMSISTPPKTSGPQRLIDYYV
eukprot:COSAG02_NODE_1641_length_11530_cov_4.345289_10_plen_95_part_00